MQWKPPGSRRADLGDAADFLPVSAGKFPEKQEFPSLVVSETQSFGKPSSSEDSLDNAACPLAIVQLPLRGRDMPPIPSRRLDPVHRRARGNKLRLEAPPVAASARVHCHNHPAHWQPLRQPTRCVRKGRRGRQKEEFQRRDAVPLERSRKRTCPRGEAPPHPWSQTPRRRQVQARGRPPSLPRTQGVTMRGRRQAPRPGRATR